MGNSGWCAAQNAAQAPVRLVHAALPKVWQGDKPVPVSTLMDARLSLPKFQWRPLHGMALRHTILQGVGQHVNAATPGRESASLVVFRVAVAVCKSDANSCRCFCY